MLALRAVISIALFLSGGAFRAEQVRPEIDESYAVYSALIPQIQSLPQTKFLISADTADYVNTKAEHPVEAENILTSEEFDKQLAQAKGTPAWSNVSKGQPCVLVPESEREAYVSAMADYRRKNEVSASLQRKFDLPKTYELVNVKALKHDKRWAVAEQEGAEGVYELSAVGFSSDMTIAIVYVGFDCPMCGRWAVHVLKKTEGKWRQVAEGCSWMS